MNGEGRATEPKMSKGVAKQQYADSNLLPHLLYSRSASAAQQTDQKEHLRMNGVTGKQLVI